MQNLFVQLITRVRKRSIDAEEVRLGVFVFTAQGQSLVPTGEVKLVKGRGDLWECHVTELCANA